MKKMVLIIAGLIVCSPFVTMAQAQQPPQGLGELAAYSIYYENYKNEEYQSAIRYGRWIHQAMPKKLQGYSNFELPRNLNRLITAYTEVANNQQDPTMRSAYLDTAQTIYQKALNEFSDEEIDKFQWKLNLGRFLESNSDFIDNGQQKAASIYLELFESDPERFTKAGEGYYIQVTIRHLVSQDQKEQALELMEQAEPYANQKVLDYFDERRNQLFDSPKERLTFLEAKLKENPDSLALIRDLADLYEQQEQPERLRELRQKLYDLNPSFENTRALAEYAINNANYSMAIQYLKEALNKAADNTTKAEIALQISNVYLNQGNLQQARSFARQAMNLNSDSGQPYLQMASIYGQAVSQCTENRELGRRDKVVYWLVLDYLDQAEQKDQSLSSQVESQYNSYQPVTPTGEDKLFFDPEALSAGDQIEVDANLMECYDWIDETTTVR